MIFKLLMHTLLRGASFFSAEGFLIWDMNCFLLVRIPKFDQVYSIRRKKDFAQIKSNFPKNVREVPGYFCIEAPLQVLFESD